MAGGTIPTYTPKQGLDIGGGMQPGGYTTVPSQVVGNFGAALSDLAQGWQAQTGSNVEASFQEFQLNENKAYNDTTFKTKPEQSQGFATNYETEHTKRADEWITKNLAGASPKEIDRYKAKLIELHHGLYSNAIKFEREQQYAYSVGQLDKSVQGIFLPRAEAVAALQDDPNKPLELAKLEADLNASIDANAVLSEAAKADQKQKVLAAIHLRFAKSLPLGDQANLDPNKPPETNIDRILRIEGAAKNPNSSAQGKGQFIDSTWVDMVKRYRPELADGKSNDEILALRTAPNLPGLNEAMVSAYAKENGAYLQTKGFDATAGNLYLAHFLGPKGAADILGGDPNASAADLNPSAAKANPTVFYAPGEDGRPDLTQPRTVAELQRWAGALMSGTKPTNWGNRLTGLTFDQRVQLSLDASSEMVKVQTKAANEAKAANDARVNGAMNAVMDGKYGLADLAADYDQGKGWLKDSGDRKKILDAIQSRDKDGLNLAAATALIGDTSKDINPYLDKDKKAVNLWYEKAGGGGADLYEGDGKGVTTLRGIVERSGLVPEAAAATLKDGIYSPDETKRGRAFTIMDGLARQNPAAYATAFSEGDRKRADIYRELSSMVPKETLAEELNPMVDSQTLKLRDERGKDGLKAFRTANADGGMAKILDAFDPSGMPFGIGGGDPAAPFEPIAQAELLNDFANVYAEAYSRVPDAAAAEALALKWLKNKWGVTDVGSGGSTLMAHPPEQRYPAVNGSRAWMDEQLDTAVKSQFPSAQSWALVTDQQTEADWSSGMPPAYRVMVTDGDGSLKPLGAPMMQRGIGSDAAARVEYSSKPALIRFDYAKAKAEADRLFMEKRAKAAIGEALGGLLAPGPADDPMYRSFKGNPANPMGRQLTPPPIDSIPLRAP